MNAHINLRMVNIYVQLGTLVILIKWIWGNYYVQFGLMHTSIVADLESSFEVLFNLQSSS